MIFFFFCKRKYNTCCKVAENVFVSTRKTNLIFNKMFSKFRTTFDEFTARCPNWNAATLRGIVENGQLLVVLWVFLLF